ncbi:MAG: FAD-dependent oxidoreductase [Anaerolineales bacterium]|nr:FAD-dependent oxidoreductase [Anaerolineales bacterium]
MSEKVESSISRKDFIKIVGAGAGGLVVGAAGGSQLFGKSPDASNLPEKWDMEADVVVVGAGGGGQAAAIEAAEAGNQVILLEVMETALQSNTALCGGVVMGSETKFQKEAGITDSIANFEKYLEAAGAGFEDPEIRHIWAQNAGQTVEWLASIGVNFPLENMYVSGNEYEFENITPAVARGHTTDEHSGRPIAQALYDTAIAKGVEFVFKARGAKLFTNASGEVVGVEADQNGTPLTVKANKGVVLATAGFSRNEDFIKNFMPKMKTGGSFGSQWQQGDGIVMGQAVGAKLETMWIPQAATIGIPTTPDMTPCNVITIWGNPCIMVAQDAKRHFREDLYYEYLYDQIAAQTGGYVWAIWDQAVTDLGGELVAVPAFSSDLSTEIEKGWVKTAPTIEELAAQLELDPEVLKATVEAHNSYAANGVDEDFGKVVGLGAVEKAPFYAAKTVPATCDTAGGLKINGNAQVVDVFGNVIPRLYATGSTTGGWRGSLYPGSGTAVSVTVTFGRIAGKHASGLESL